jgi:hypothetical protein
VYVKESDSFGLFYRRDRYIVYFDTFSGIINEKWGIADELNDYIDVAYTDKIFVNFSNDYIPTKNWYDTNWNYIPLNITAID